MRKWTYPVLPVLMILLTSACSSMLPRSSTESSLFQSFDEARAAIEALVPMQSDKSTLAKNGFNPAKHPNTTILTHADVVRRFVPTALLKREDLDSGILACVEARSACNGMELSGGKISRARTGNFLADFSNFKRRTVTTGWRFNAVILFVNDRVVYRSWSGQPAVNEIEVNTNPLGPFQDIGPSMLSNR